MNPSQNGPKRDLQISSSKGDPHILRVVSKLQFATVDQVAEEIGRNIIAVRRRMMQMYRASVLNRSRRDELAPYVYFLGEKGASASAQLGFIPEPRYIKSKSRLIINHDLEITDFHRTLEKALKDAGKTLAVWEQWRGDLKDEVKTVRGKESIIPDARFVMGEQCFFLEVVKSYESEYEDGNSNIVKKIGLYDAYPRAFKERHDQDDFRVLWVLPTQERVAALLSKLEDKFPFRRFYFTDEVSYKKDVLGKIWWTPKDFRTAIYSLL